MREIQALRRLNLHPNIIQLEEVIFDAKYGILSLCFEIMDHNLYDVLSKKGAPPFSENKTKWIMFQVGKALEFVHGKGVFHRDIKPENILVRGDIHAVPEIFPSPDASSLYHDTTSFPVVKLADFGSCRGISSRMPYTEYIATRWYRSPECLLFDGIYSYKMDIWGAGCVLYELLTRTPLFAGDNELDQLHRIHEVFGTPSDRLLKSMVAAGTKAMLVAPNGQRNTKAAGHLIKGIWKHTFSFPLIKGYGIRDAFAPHIVNGASKSPLPLKCTHPESCFPGLSDNCLNILELLLQYDPDARPSVRHIMKHPWLKECRDVELFESELLHASVFSPILKTASTLAHQAVEHTVLSLPRTSELPKIVKTFKNQNIEVDASYNTVIERKVDGNGEMIVISPNLVKPSSLPGMELAQSSSNIENEFRNLTITSPTWMSQPQVKKEPLKRQISLLRESSLSKKKPSMKILKSPVKSSAPVLSPKINKAASQSYVVVSTEPADHGQINNSRVPRLSKPTQVENIELLLSNNDKILAKSKAISTSNL